MSALCTSHAIICQSFLINVTTITVVCKIAQNLCQKEEKIVDEF